MFLRCLSDVTSETDLLKPNKLTLDGIETVSFGRLPFLLDVKEHDAIVVLEQETTGASVEDVVTVWHLHLLRYLVLQVLHDNLTNRQQHNAYNRNRQLMQKQIATTYPTVIVTILEC